MMLDKAIEGKRWTNPDGVKLTPIIVGNHMM